MHFDDRLGTVLRQPVSGDVVARIQYVQLLDLLGNLTGDAEGAGLDSAYERLLQLSARFKPAERANLLRGSGLRLRNPRLLAFLSEDAPDVSSAAIDAAELTQDEWLDLIPALPIMSRGILRHRRDLGPVVEDRLEQLGVADRGLPATDAAIAMESPPPFPEERASAKVIPLRSEPEASDTGIGEIVRKIEAYRKEHAARQGQTSPDAPRLPLGDGETAAKKATVPRFDFVTDARGTIIEADPGAAPMLIGLSLISLGSDASSLSLERAVALRQPIARHIVTIELAAAISGEWQIDAAPLFDDLSGHFTGYAGRARRVQQLAAPSSTVTGNADRMRQVLHELRNPAGAIQMSSELIQQQLGGDVPHEYRAIAASIASDTAIVLAGFEELDRLVKLNSLTMRMETGETDIVAAVENTLGQIHRHTEQRQSGFALKVTEHALPIALERIELDRLLWRLLAAIAGAAGAMEMLDLSLTRKAGMARLEISLPQGLRELTEDELYHAQAGDRNRVLSAGIFGLGFTLRLARAEARAAGGALQAKDGHLVLTLPEASDPNLKFVTV